MVKDNQVRMLMKLIHKEETLKTAAAKAGMSEKTARKYRKSGTLPSQCKVVHDWRTRQDLIDHDDWLWIEDVLETNNGIEAKTLLEFLQREHPGRYQDGQLRTFQRRAKLWRATKGPGNEVFFPQIYKPGEWCESDFTRMKPLGITINGIPFDHMLYHFVLCYSNWETVTVCFSESYESLSAGLQNALWKLGGVAQYHRTDNLTSAVKKVGHPEVFTDKYRGLASHYGFESQKIQPRCPHENGDVEQRHHRLKKAIDQALMLRGSRDFASREDYEQFLEKLLDQLNSGRRKRLKEELAVLRQLPRKRHDDYTEVKCKVTRFSTIRVLKNSYSLHSRLIGERVATHFPMSMYTSFPFCRKPVGSHSIRSREEPRIFAETPWKCHSITPPRQALQFCSALHRPGQLAKAHTRDESVSFEQVTRAARLYLETLRVLHQSEDT